MKSHSFFSANVRGMMCAARVIGGCFVFFALLLIPFEATASEVEFRAAYSDKTHASFHFSSDAVPPLATIDLGKDGTSELVAGSAGGSVPSVRLFRLNGSLMNEWLAYDRGFRGGVSVAAGDFDGDGSEEIAAAPLSDGGPHVRIFDGYGRPLTPGFFAESRDYRGAMRIVAVRREPARWAIAAVTKRDGYLLSLFDGEGRLVSRSDLAPTIKKLSAISRIDLGGDGTDEVALAGVGDDGKSRVWIFRLDGSLINSFDMGTDEALFLSPMQKSAGAGHDLAVSLGGRGMVVFDGFGKRLRGSEPATSPHIGLAVMRRGAEELLSLPQRVRTLDREGKAIVIRRDTQQLSYYEDGYRVGTFVVSTGRLGAQTPKGEYAINNKSPRAYSARAGLYMPYWMSFIGGVYGIHELPEWPNGYKEGENHLGIPVSAGCVRLGRGDAQTLYEWAEVGTAVIIL